MSIEEDLTITQCPVYLGPVHMLTEQAYCKKCHHRDNCIDLQKGIEQ